MKISLCVICGNEAKHIERMLGSFANAFDELALVRACGAVPPDNTLDLARAWCDANGKTYLGSDYINGLDARDWEHVDDFAAARNDAFALGRGQWLFWADCDDLCADAKGLRQAMENAPQTVAMLRFPYDVRGTNKAPQRERCVRRSAWEAGARWQYPVHENIVVPQGNVIADHDGPAWIHSPLEIALANRKRNLRILARTLKEAPMNFFYLHQEHYCAGNRHSAEGIGDIVVQFPGLDDAFKVETWLNIARITSDRDKAMESALTAHSRLPWCREPLAALVMLCFERNDAGRALHWAQTMASTPEPTGAARPWTHEPKWYGYAGDDVLARALRLTGNELGAEAVQRKYHNHETPTFSLCHATRGRTSMALQCRDSWIGSADNPRAVEHIFAVDADDRESAQMAKQFVSVTSDKKTCVAAWNLAAEKATGKILIQLSDDWQPFAGWDTALLKAIGDRTGEFVVAVSDGTRKDDLLCMAILSRARWEKQGREMFSAEYESMYSDNEFSVRAFADGVVIDARATVTFRHIHPAFGTAHDDPTYRHTNHPDRYARGLETFQRRNPTVRAKRMPRFTQAEITEADEFGQALARYSTGTRCALEIGGGFGDGSTRCIKSARLYSIENHPANVDIHERNLGLRVQGFAIRGNATHVSEWMTRDDVTHFYETIETRLNQYPLAMVLSWLDEDREVAGDGGSQIENIGEQFDFVLIDGCPFSAESELAAVRAKLLPGAFVALDDVCDIKNHANYHALKREEGVRLVWENLNLRNGAAIFQMPTA